MASADFKVEVGGSALEVAALIAEMHAANARIEAMKAGNMSRAADSEPMMYFDFDFLQEAEKIDRIVEKIRAIKKPEDSENG